MGNITLQQDAADKLTVTIDEQFLISKIKRYFKWRKDVTISRLNKLGTSERDKFIKAISRQ